MVESQSVRVFRLLTSAGLLEMVTPFSLGMLLELLLGELGPEPGALLQAESRVHKNRDAIFFLKFLHPKSPN